MIHLVCRDGDECAHDIRLSGFDHKRTQQVILRYPVVFAARQKMWLSNELCFVNPSHALPVFTTLRLEQLI